MSSYKMNWNDTEQTINSGFPHKWGNKGKGETTVYFKLYAPFQRFNLWSLHILSL